MKSKTFSTSFFSGLRYLLLPGIFALSVAQALANGPDQEFTKNFSREFPTLANGMTALYNKYGKINVNTWNNNSVKIDVTIIVNANNQSQADEVFEKINVNFTSTAGYIKAETIIELENNNNWWVNLGGNKYQDYKINYEVWMPAGNQLDLKNKYGNSYVGNLNGKLIAEVKYGDLRTESINNDADLYVSYGKASLVKANNINGQISYGGLNVTNAGDVQIDTKYSECNIEQARSLRITSKYDDFDLGKIGDLRVQTKYADLKLQQAQSLFVTAQYTEVSVGSLAEKVDADLMYGSMKIDNLNRNFADVNINAKYTDIKLSVERGTNFRFDISSNHTGVTTPSGATIRHRDDSNNHKNLDGYVGDANARANIKARLNYGGITLR